MPLRDHFRPPLDNLASWEEFHGGWPMEIVRSLDRKLPPEFVAAPHVHHGAFIEVDVATFEKDEGTPPWKNGHGEEAATAVWAPPQPTPVLIQPPAARPSRRGLLEGRFPSGLAGHRTRRWRAPPAADRRLGPKSLRHRLHLGSSTKASARGLFPAKVR